MKNYLIDAAIWLGLLGIIYAACVVSELIEVNRKFDEDIKEIDIVEL